MGWGCMRASRATQISTVGRRQTLRQGLRDGSLEQFLPQDGRVGPICFLRCAFVSGRSFRLSKLYSLRWKCNSLWGARFALREGVAGEASSWSSEKLAWRSCPERLGMNLPSGQLAFTRSCTSKHTYHRRSAGVCDWDLRWAVPARALLGQIVPGPCLGPKHLLVLNFGLAQSLLGCACGSQLAVSWIRAVR